MEERYQYFTVHDFIQDTFFYEWVTAPTRRHNSFWQLWLNLYPEKKAVIEEAREEISRLVSGGQPTVADHMEQDWQQIEKAISPPNRIVPYQRKYWYAIVASFLLMLGFGFYVWWQAAQHSWRHIETAYGEQRTVLLPDGSEVILNGNSQLRYATAWEDTSTLREVWLEGEAFFSVTKQKRKMALGRVVPVKFTVHTSRVQVEVLSTEFDVRSRKQKTQVVLSEGRVLVHNDALEDSLLLRPGELVELNEQQHHLAKRPVNDKAYSSWKDQKLTFENEELYHIFRRLEDTYGWKIKTNDTSWLRQRYTGSVPVGQVELLFDKLATLYDMRVKRQGKKIWFDKK